MIGTLIAGRYRIDAPLGAGGMGTVYRATDERLGRPVAVKLLVPELASDTEAIARFEREARATARLTHPGIVQIHDFGAMPAPSGRGMASYLVMELAEGETLAKRLERAPLPQAEAIAIGLEILGALSAAHAAGIVHRDLKPENVMISAGDVRGADATQLRVKLLDFGLAQIKAGTAYTRLTQTGAILGTPRYMAPEQARAEPCDARTDVYATGLVLHAAMAGRAPFDAESIAAIVSQVLEAKPPRLDAIAPGVSAGVASAIETAIQKRPEQRFASAQAFASALEQAQASSKRVATPAAFAPTAPVAVVPATTPPMPTPPAPAPPGRSFRGPILAILGAIGFAVALVLAFFFGESRAPSSSSPSPSPSPSVSPSPSASPSHAHVASPPPLPSTTVAVPPSTVAPASAAAPPIPVCRMAVHCCELVGGAHDACQTQPIGGADAPPGGDPTVCPLTVRSYHDVLIAQHRDASACEWPPSTAHATPTPDPAPPTSAAPPPSATPSRACAMATHCCMRTGGDHASCDRYGDMPDPELCVAPIHSYHTVLENQHEDASDCVWP